MASIVSILLLILSAEIVSGFIPSQQVAIPPPRNTICLRASTIESVQLKGGAEVKIGHRMQIGGLEADGDLTGLKMWPTTSEPMFRYLVDVALPAMHNKSSGKRDASAPFRILELGSGCGLLGISLAAHGEEVVLTDPAFPFRDTEGDSEDKDDTITTLDHLQHNIDLNVNIVDGRAKAAKLLWGDENDITNIIDREGPFDLVIGSELLYYVESFSALLETIRCLGVGGVPILLGYKTRRLGEQKFLDQANEDFEIQTDRLGRKHEGLFLATCTLKEPSS